MKKLLILLSLIISSNANNFKIALDTNNYQDSEGGGISLLYKINNKLLIETSYNQFYIRGVKNDSTVESWNKFNTQRLGIRYYLRSYSNNEIKLFTSIGLEHIYTNYELSSNKPKLNSYGLVGLDFKASNNFNITFAFGSSGKGEKADKLISNPNYAHGFNSIIGIEYNF
jgi:hypothetical protein